MQCFTIQIKAKSTSSCLIFWEQEEGEGLHSVIGGEKGFSATEELFTA